MSYIYMKVLESAPERYDRGMRLLTLGRLDRLQHDIAARLEAGSKALDLGCGTGALAALLVRQGVQVTGVDISPQMLAQAARRFQQEGLTNRVTLRELGVVDLDTAFPDSSFDAVASTLVFSELSDDEVEYALVECWRMLRPGGRLFIADEILPDSVLGRMGTSIMRLPLAILVFVLTQNTTHRVGGLQQRIQDAGFQIVEIRRYLAGTLQLLVAEKTGR